LCASDGETAIRKCLEEQPDFLLVDVDLPMRDGYEVCERIRGESGIPQPKILLLCAPFEPVDAERARICGADDHLPKPFESQTLLERVRGLRTGAGVSPSTPSHPEEKGPFPPASSVVDPEPPNRVQAPEGSPTETEPATRIPPSLSPSDIDAIARRVVELIGP